MRSLEMRGLLVTVLLVAFAFATVRSAPAPQDEVAPAEGPVRGFRDPFDLGINIPDIFNLKLLTGRSRGTDLGIDVPSILNLKLDRNRGRPGGLLLDLFGGRSGGGRSLFTPSEAENKFPDKS
ncbi:hypothetical protein HPB52_008006 [Rhipicephalus sanguineus]|uniref:Secreted protein n=1 Tax=Rhipicephalus sanguineus TaxID=34632 RepID=A0A9D4PR38_RHISA|nr:hypothetical protein HPB52_008006 [Rhipicephalus sanguineus]